MDTAIINFDDISQGTLPPVFDAQARIALDDAHISGPGAVGVWTRADSVTAFDDFRYGSLR